MKTRYYSIAANVRDFIMVLALAVIPVLTPTFAIAYPTLYFSDIDSGPKTGNTDGAGGLAQSQHGAIVTIWGHNLGSSQGTSKVYVGGLEAANVYYWKDADGQLPGGPSDLKTYHKMQEIAFSIPAAATDGLNTIKVIVGGVESNTIPFTVRAGNIYFVASSGNDSTGKGTYVSPWLTLENVFAGGNGKIAAGDIVYSVGVGTTKSLQVGQTSVLVGTSANPISLIAYPNSAVAISNTNAPLNVTAVRNYNHYPSTPYLSSYINFSKLSVTTVQSGFSGFQGMRVVGCEGTGPTYTTGGGSGFIGGGVANGSSLHLSDGKMYGLYIHNYGAVGNTDTMQHLFYISNRSGSPIPGYEIAWGHFTDNPIYQGLHVYDQGVCGDWSTPIRLHHNVIVNQRGNAININTGCTPVLTMAQIEIHDNIIVIDPSHSTSVAAIRYDADGTRAKIYNNTVYGYNSTNTFGHGTIEFVNNLIVDRKAIAFFDNAPSSQSNNLFHSISATPPPAPSWAIGAIMADPLFSNPSQGDFWLKPGSPALDMGSEIVIPTAPIDFFGYPRQKSSVSIGSMKSKPNDVTGVRIITDNPSSP